MPATVVDLTFFFSNVAVQFVFTSVSDFFSVAFKVLVLMLF